MGRYFSITARILTRERKIDPPFRKKYDEVALDLVYKDFVKMLFKGKASLFDGCEFPYEVSAPKYDGYLLDLDSEKGGSKAKFLRDVLNYNKGDGRKLHEAIAEALDGKIPDSSEQTPYGLKCRFKVRIKGNGGKWAEANVEVVIQKDNGRIVWRIITLFPGRKD